VPEETVSEALMERVNQLLPGGKARSEWGSPALSTTPISVAVPQLAAQVAALEKAVREIALEVQKLSAQQ
jgi:hypothetical protein